MELPKNPACAGCPRNFDLIAAGIEEEFLRNQAPLLVADKMLATAVVGDAPRSSQSDREAPIMHGLTFQQAKVKCAGRAGSACCAEVVEHPRWIAS